MTVMFEAFKWEWDGPDVLSGYSWFLQDTFEWFSDRFSLMLCRINSTDQSVRSSGLFPEDEPHPQLLDGCDEDSCKASCHFPWSSAHLIFSKSILFYDLLYGCWRIRLLVSFYFILFKFLFQVSFYYLKIFLYIDSFSMFFIQSRYRSINRILWKHWTKPSSDSKQGNKYQIHRYFCCSFILL